MNKKFLLGVIIVGVIIGTMTFSRLYINGSQEDKNSTNTAPTPQEKVYIALEEEGKVAVFNPRTRKVQAKIDLANDGIHYMAHNVQVAADGKSVWVTANAEGAHDTGNSSHGMDIQEHAAYDEVVVINPQNDTIIKRIPLAKEAHLAHVVLSTDSKTAYITAQTGNAIYKVNAVSYKVQKEIVTPKESQPHGIRISTDNAQAFVAMMGSKALGILNLQTDEFIQQPLEGMAVQTGVTPDGKYALASIYDKKRLALYELATQKVSSIALPVDAKGALQIYVTPDSRYVYVADQGYYFNEPISDKVYKIDLKNKSVVKTITAGKAPHGIAIDKAGKYAYVTNLVGGDLSVIDLKTDTEVARIPVGSQPNGVSILH